MKRKESGTDFGRDHACMAVRLIRVIPLWTEALPL